MILLGPKQTASAIGQDPLGCLSGGGEMGARMRAFDWSRTPLGPVADWPQSLRTAVSILLSSRHPMFIWWGPELVQFYNDGYRPSLGTHMHPGALGQRGEECWTEIWPIIGPQIAGVMSRGQETWHEDQLVPFDRNGYLEEIYFTYGYSPIRDESGDVGGTLVVCTETTARVLSERRLRTLRDLAARSVVTERVEESCRLAAEVLATNPYDLPFALLYLLDEPRRVATLAGLAGIEPQTLASPRSVDLSDPGGFGAGPSWPLARVAASGRAERVEDLGRSFGTLPGGAWGAPPGAALVLPITPPGRELPSALLVAGLNPRKALDESYRTFLDLAAGQVATALAHVHAHEQERRRAEGLDELREAKEAAEAANQAKDRFLAALSHELRTPLTPVLAVLARLERESGLAGPLREDLDRIKRNVELEARLIDDLLDLTRIARGKLELSTGRGQGAVFTVELPDGPPRPGSCLHILLVEDHLDTALAMAELLSAMGHRVTTAGGVGEGLRAAAAAHGSGNGSSIDLVVSDLGLPDGHGHDLMRELKSRYGLSGIALSGYGMEEDVRHSREAGFDRHLTKPVGIQALEAAIRESAPARTRP
jgi:CheY-like chemotaxis protein